MATTNGVYYSQISGLTISTNSKKRVIVSTGGTSTFTGDTYGGKVIDAVGTEGGLFSVSDDLTGDILVVTNDVGGTIFAVNAYDPVRISGVTSGSSSNEYLVIQPNGVIKTKTSPVAGTSGVSGISGFDAIGTSGRSGISGLSGTGPSGISGTSGQSGISGISGISGRSGISGISGISGQSGISGISGNVGPTGGGITWNSANTTQSMTSGNGYITTATTLTTFTLPSSIALGATVVAYGNSTGLWQINQNSGQSIRIGNSTTTTTTGILSATSQGDCVYLVCSTANTSFIVVSSIGNIFFS